MGRWSGAGLLRGGEVVVGNRYGDLFGCVAEKVVIWIGWLWKAMSKICTISIFA